jgi:chitinase
MQTPQTFQALRGYRKRREQTALRGEPLECRALLSATADLTAPIALPEAAALPNLVAANFTTTERDAQSFTQSLVFRLTAPSSTPITVQYVTQNGTATAGQDYVATSGTLTIAPGDVFQFAPLTILGDKLDEADETFVVRLMNPSGVVLLYTTRKVTIRDNDAAPTIAIGDATASEPTGGVSSSAGYFHTSGNQILDTNGQPVKIAGVSWFGMETDTFSPHGLWSRNWKSMMDQMVAEGFNTIRLPYSNQLFDSGSKPNDIDFSLNPDLKNLSGIQIIDKIVGYAGQIGLRIFLDHHRSSAGAGPNDNGLWYTSAYPESRWISDWTMLAQRYVNNPTVIGGDIHNEPYDTATWGTGGVKDWRLAAERAGNAILAVNPNWLIIVEGVQEGDSGSYWWGGNLSRAGQFPVRLNVPGRLVYSPHDYPQSVYNEDWFKSPNYPNNLASVWDASWGYLYRQNLAPILLGEFGTKLQTQSDQLWFSKMIDYLGGDLDTDGDSDLAPGKLGMSWTFWCWNPNSGDTGGILNNDWTTVNRAKVDALKEIQFKFPTGETPSTPQNVLLTVSLSTASGQPVTVAYATANGTAAAGSDYTASSGTLTFDAGVKQLLVTIPILHDIAAEANETFFVRLSNLTNGTLADGEARVTIIDNDGAPQPTLTVSDVSLTEGNSGTSNALFTVSLSTASSQPVTVAYATANDTATAPSDYTVKSGTLTFAAGSTTAQIVTVPIVGDTAVESSETFRLNLSNAIGAALARSFATATIVDNDQPAGGVTAASNVSDNWGAGFVAGIKLTNNRTAAITPWTLEFDLDAEITNIWNAKIKSHAGKHYVIEAADWNQTIGANGGIVEFGFQAAGAVGSGTRNLLLNGTAI